MMEDVTFIIKTFMRPNALMRLVRSVVAGYPASPILIADDSPADFAPPAIDGAALLRLPFDTGLAAGRNAMLDRVATPLFCNLDDDMELVAESNLRYLRAVLERKDFDLVAGRAKWAEPPYWIVRYEGNFRRSGTEIVLDANGLRGGVVAADGFHVEYRNAEIVPNFFLARTDAVRRVRWDPQFKIGGEHEDFFWRARGNLRVAFCPQVWVNHYRDDQSAEYGGHRQRGLSGRERFLAKHGFSRIRHEPPEYWNYR